jgi:tetratricopeptide (TPR) repeat protein
MVKSLTLCFIISFLPFGYIHASEARPAPSQEYRKANTLLASSQFREALSLYQKLLASPPQGVPVSDIHARIGDSYFGLGLYKNALDSYRTALKDRKEAARPETQYWIGFCCFLLGRDAEAVTEFLKIPQQYPDAGMWGGTAYYWAGRACQRLGRLEEAAGYFRKAGGNGRSTQGRFALKKAEGVRGASTKEQ